MLRVAINGYGRIGRNVHRQFVEYFGSEVEVVAVNASSDADMRAYLLKYDSLHGRFGFDVKAQDGKLIINGKECLAVKERDPAKCPWKELNVDVVVEATGNFTNREKAEAHLKAGAKRVIVTAPMKDETPTFVKGVNEEQMTGEHDIVSNGSCTTNCIAPVIKVMQDAFGVERLLVGSVHAFTVSQNLLDNKPKDEGEGSSKADYRRARAATLSIIPTKTGAVKACAKIFPELKGKLDGMAFRVPVPTVSCAYMAFTTSKAVTAEVVNEAIQKASEQRMKEILTLSTEPLVSIDLQTDPHSSIVDAEFTKVVDDRGVQILSWYDNEWGYAMRVTEMTMQLGKLIS